MDNSSSSLENKEITERETSIDTPSKIDSDKLTLIDTKKYDLKESESDSLIEIVVYLIKVFFSNTLFFLVVYLQNLNT